VSNTTWTKTTTGTYNVTLTNLQVALWPVSAQTGHVPNGASSTPLNSGPLLDSLTYQ
jgi:hypothetical protein